MVDQFINPASGVRSCACNATHLPAAHPLLTVFSETFAGTFTSSLLGRFTALASNEGLRFRWGVLKSLLEVFDAPTDRLRLEIAGAGRVVGFQSGKADYARSLVIDGITFTRN